ncbi:RDD family protein [Blastococcus sp. SYSU DS0539]
MVRNVEQPSQAPDRGASLGLPAAGAGSLASFSRRAGGFVVDALGTALIGWAFTAPDGPGNWSLVIFGVLTVVTLVLFGQTPGHRVFGMRLAHPRPGARLALWRAVVRTALLMLLVPALLVDADGRGLHDRLTGTAVVLD